VSDERSSDSDSSVDVKNVDEPGVTAPPVDPEPRRPWWAFSRRTWTLLISLWLTVALGTLGAFVRVPYVAVGPGPTYDVLGSVGAEPVITINGHETYPTGGQFRMVTVSVLDDVTLFGALTLWISGRHVLAPREEYYPPGQSQDDVAKKNTAQFQGSQTNAEVAALRSLGFPVQVIAQEVVGGSPADKVIAPGDRLLVVNGKTIATEDDVRPALADTKPGQAVSVTFRHEGKDVTAQVTLARSDDGQRGFLGIAPIDRADVPFEVKISLKDVGGPSAGLMFALSIVDKLTPGELNGGKVIAGTGEIDEKGTVKQIGGIELKLVAAREAGATVFLVPAANCAEARNDVPDGLQLVKVDTLATAVTALNQLNEGKSPQSC
jgi:PDZ domain-containing protein